MHRREVLVLFGQLAKELREVMKNPTERNEVAARFRRILGPEAGAVILQTEEMGL